ncbi:hypothetical protein [Rosenbergiella epipactidis]|uniref:hypothetical protein n=1 Tax=Rosenbergiella epipactidis TaxID=1544694 RepID=UPI001F4DB2A6|nr:hypothetical protein [Rosenbergiella epipactidis]
MENKRLSDVFSGDDLDMVNQDLAQSADLIDSWLEGGEIDPDLLGYMVYFFESLTSKFPQS